MNSSSTPNPFPFTSPASGQDFYGRRGPLQRIFAAVLEGRSVAISAPRYLGKSSLLAHVQTADVQRLYGLNPKRWIFARVPCSKVSTAPELVDLAVEAIRRALGLRTHSLLSPTAQQVLERRDPEDTQSEALPRNLSDLSPVGRSLQARHGGLVLLLDDFENLLALPDRAILTDLLGLAASGVSLILTLDHDPHEIIQDPDQVLSNQSARSFYRPYHQGGFKTFVSALADVITLGPLSEEEAREILEEGFEQAGTPLSEEDTLLILALGGGHPALLQTAAFISFHQLATGNARLDPDLTITATEDAARTYLQALWRDLSLPAQARAIEVAKGNIREDAPSEVDDELRSKNLLRPTRDGEAPALFSTLFQRFVLDRIPVSMPSAGEEDKAKSKKGDKPSRPRSPSPAKASGALGLPTPEQGASGRSQSSISWALPFPLPTTPTPDQEEESQEPSPIKRHTNPYRDNDDLGEAPPSPWTSREELPPIPTGDGSPPPAKKSPKPKSPTRAPRLFALLLALGLIAVFYMTVLNISGNLQRTTSQDDPPVPVFAERGPRSTTVTLLLLLSAPLLGLGTGLALRRTLPLHNSQGFPRKEEDAQRTLQAALKNTETSGPWASTLLEMSQSTTLDAIADARWAIDALEVAQDGRTSLFDAPEPAVEAFRALAGVTQECSAASRATSSSARAIHLARALASLEAVEDPLAMMDPGTTRDGLWLVGRVWRRILVDAVEGSAGRALLTATLLTQQVRYDEHVEVVLEVANSGTASAIDVQFSILPPVGAALIQPTHHQVGAIEPGLSARVRFGLKPYRREPIYLTFQIGHREPLRGDQVLQLNERLAFVTLGEGFTRVQPIPYVTGKPLEPGQIFVGRRQDLNFVKEALLESATPPTILVIGRRRMGKTSLLRHIPYHLGSFAVTAQIDFQARPADDLTHLMAWMAGRLRAQHPDGPLPPVPYEEFEADPGNALMKLALDPLLSAAGTGPVVLLIDEVESLYEPMETGGLSARFFENMRSLLQKRPRVALVLAGTLKLAERSAQVTSVLFGAALTRELGFLTRDDVGVLMRDPLKAFNIEVAPLAVDRLHQLSGGHPLLSQHLCYHLTRRLNQLEVNFVTAEDVEAVEGEAIEGAQDHLRLWWTQADTRGRIILATLAKGQNKPRSAADIQGSLQRFNIRPRLGDVRATLRNLAHLGLIKEHGPLGTNQFRQELFRRWVGRYHSSQEARARIGSWDESRG